MTSSPKHESQLLIDFYRLVFARDRFGTVAPKTLEKYRKTINRFESCLGRAAQLADLSGSSYFAFKDWLADRYSLLATRDTLNRLLTIWCRAHELGAVAELPFGSRLPGMPKDGCPTDLHKGGDQ
jgi:hypothetical protein